MMITGRIDHYLMDRETGSVVAGFDEMAGDVRKNIFQENESERESKDEKIFNIIKKGGASIKYGATIKNKILVKKSMRSVPVFYLAINPSDLESVLPEVSKDSISEKKKKFLNS